MDSEVEGEEHDDVRLSQSSTDTGDIIELPGCAMETDGGKIHVADEEECTVGSGDRHDEGVIARIESTGIVKSQMTDTPTAPGKVATPVLLTGENVAVTPLIETAIRKVVDTTSTPVVASEIKSGDRSRILRDVGAAELMRAEIAKTNPEFASVSAFIEMVCGERRVTGKDEGVDGADVDAVVNAYGKVAGEGDDVASLDTRQRSSTLVRVGILTGSELSLVEGELTRGQSEFMEETVEIESEMEVTGESGNRYIGGPRNVEC